jgi:hypothetical protein
MKLPIILFSLTLLMACNSGNKTDKKTFEVDTKSLSSDLPEVKDLITGAQIEEALKLQPGAMYDIRPNSNSRSTSAFFKLDDPEKGNAAILIQISKNPSPEEYIDWDILYMESILQGGEKSLDPNVEPMYYKPMDIGVEGAGNSKLGKYYWRDEHQHIYLLAFNVTKTPEEINEAALKIGKIIDSNY